MQADDDRIGAHLLGPDSPLQRLLGQVDRIQRIQALVRDWAREPLADSLAVANERADVVVIHTASAAAHTELHYRRTELLAFLRARLDEPGLRLVTRVRPDARK